MANLKSIDTAFTQAVESKTMPGIVAMAATDKGMLYEGAFGKREIGKNAPMTLDTVVWIASMTKAITATAAMQLVEQGKLSLDQPASAVVPELGSAQVLEGFDAAASRGCGAPKRPITLTPPAHPHRGLQPTRSGAPDIARYQQATGTPGITTCTERRAHHAAAVRSRRPLGLRHQHRLGGQDGRGGRAGSSSTATSRTTSSGRSACRTRASSSRPPSSARAWRACTSGTTRARSPPVEFELPQEPEFLMGGGGLYGTAGDYLASRR